MALRSDFHKIVIGRSGLVSFVEFSTSAVPAKVDTGAYRSAVHATNIKEEGGVLTFELLGNHPVCEALSFKVRTEDYSRVWVANSFGHREERYEVRLKVKIGPKVFPARFTLANRSKKVYPILIGRKILNGRFLVDTSQSTLNRVELKQKYGVVFPPDEEEGREEGTSEEGIEE